MALFSSACIADKLVNGKFLGSSIIHSIAKLITAQVVRVSLIFMDRWDNITHCPSYCRSLKPLYVVGVLPTRPNLATIGQQTKPHKSSSYKITITLLSKFLKENNHVPYKIKDNLIIYCIKKHFKSPTRKGMSVMEFLFFSTNFYELLSLNSHLKMAV